MTDEQRLPPELVAIAKRECAEIVKVIRASYSPPDAIETILFAGFISGARWVLEGSKL